MEKIIYISGPITDNATGLPRDGWEKDFIEAEEKLNGMGFKAVTPVEIAKCIEEDYDAQRGGDACGGMPQKPPRWWYVGQCIFVLMAAKAVSMCEKDIKGILSGLYVIGAPADIQQSYGTICEINFALSADIPVFSQHFNGHQIDNRLLCANTKPTLAEMAEEEVIKPKRCNEGK